MSKKRPPMPKYEASAVPWSEDMRFTEKQTTIDAKSYRAWVEEALPQMIGAPHIQVRERANEKGVVVGDFLFAVRNMPVYEWRQSFYFMFSLGPARWQKTVLPLNHRGQHITWDGPVCIPLLIDKGGDVWMSLTPMEVYTQRAGVKRARGKTLMGGLGMGWLARRVLERKQVEHLTIYDTDKAVLDFFGQPLKKEFGKRLKLVHGDVFKAKQPEKYDRVLLDVWPGYGGVSYDRRVKEMLERGVTSKSLWTWGGRSEYLQR